MALVVLPPGNKFKILSAFELTQLVEVVKDSPDFKSSMNILEDKWRSSEDVFDIDLLSIIATPLSEQQGYPRGQENESLKERKVKAREMLKRRKNYRRRSKKVKLEPIPETTKGELEDDPSVADLPCGQGDSEWEAAFNNPELYDRLFEQSLQRYKPVNYIDTLQKFKDK